MRRRYRFWACPTGPCPKIRAHSGQCPDHDIDMVEVVLRREDPVEQAKQTADKLQATSDKIAGKGPMNKAFDDLDQSIQAIQDAFGKSC
jgi:hypothetical protein